MKSFSMNIYLISYEFPPLRGGEGVYSSGLAKSLLEHGQKLHVITTDLQGSLQSSIENSIIRIAPTKKPGLKLYSFGVKAGKKLEEIQKNEKIDIIHFTNDVMHLSIPRNFEKPVFATVHHPWFVERRIIRTHFNNIYFLRYVLSRKIYYLERLERQICKKSDKIIAVSNFTAESIIEEYKIPPDKVLVIPNAVDTERFNPKISGRQIKERFNLSKPIILFVGKLDFHKGTEDLLKSFVMVKKEISDAALLMVGEGPMKGKIMSFIKNHDLQESVVLAGNVKDEELPKYYAASDVLILPSLMEGFGIVLLEAMSSGKPCVATRCGGAEEVVLNGETGYLVPPANPSSLYDSINTLLSDEKLSKKFGKACRKRVLDNFSWEIIGEQTINAYKGMPN